MKIQLIRPPLDDWYGDKGQLEELISVPANLCLLATALREDGHQVEVLDGLNKPLEATLERIGADYVGITEVYAMHLNALALSKAAKSRGATTILGGTNVNFIADRIINNQKHVDFVVVGDGEKALPKIVAGEKPENISNLVYRKDGKAIPNPREYLRPNVIFDLENLADWQMFRKDNYFPVAGIKGCTKAEESGRCSFCSVDTKLKVMNPELYWEQIDLLHEKYGIKRFWESGDQFVVGNSPQKLLEARPKHLAHIGFKIYTGPKLTSEQVEVLKELNVTEIFIGMESSNDKILELANKQYTFDDIHRTLDVIEGWDVVLHFPFIYRLPGETLESANQTYQFAQYLTERFATGKVVASVAVPFVGTQLFEDLRNNPNVREKYLGDLDKDDFFDYRALLELTDSELSVAEALKFAEKTKVLAPLGGRTSFYINE